MSKTLEQTAKESLPSPDKQSLLEGKVAAILSERDVVINLGANEGVKPGMIFKILAKSSFQITDPDTQEVIGFLVGEKARVIVTEVKEKMSICRSIPKYWLSHKLRGAVAGGAIGLFAFGPIGAAAGALLPLLLSENAIPKIDANYVKVGDNVALADDLSQDEADAIALPIQSAD